MAPGYAWGVKASDFIDSRTCEPPPVVTTGDPIIG